MVIFSGWNSFGYGYTIVLSHGPFTTVYGHLSRIDVRCRQSVGAGQVIGALGNSGNSTGPHLHFEIRYLDTPAEPGRHHRFLMVLNGCVAPDRGQWSEVTVKRCARLLTCDDQARFSSQAVSAARDSAG